jgi:hypothetical protein
VRGKESSFAETRKEDGPDTSTQKLPFGKMSGMKLRRFSNAAITASRRAIDTERAALDSERKRPSFGWRRFMAEPIYCAGLEKRA